MTPSSMVLPTPPPPSDLSTCTPSTDVPQSSPAVSLSTVFYPGAHAIPEDLVFTSLESVYFYVHSFIFSGAARHAFQPILSAPLSDPRYQRTVIPVPETSEVLNIIFHTIYNISCLKNSPSFDTLTATLDHMPTYEINPKNYIVPSGPLHELLLHFMPHHPLEVYAIAAQYDVYDIAKATSAHLLSYPLSGISDEMAARMGAVYLKRLGCLHANRLSVLKATVRFPPTFHAATETCTYDDQGKLSRAWILTAAYLVWDALPGLSVYRLEAAFRPLQDKLTCPKCHEIFSARVRDAVREWSLVELTI